MDTHHLSQEAVPRQRLTPDDAPTTSEKDARDSRRCRRTRSSSWTLAIAECEREVTGQRTGPTHSSMVSLFRIIQNMAIVW